MKLNDKIKRQTGMASVIIACTLMASCKSEIVDGTTDIDNWPLVSIDVTYPEEGFVHPGVLFDQNDIDRWRSIVQNQTQPQYGGFEVLLNDELSNPNYVMNGPYEQLYSGDADVLTSI